MNSYERVRCVLEGRLPDRVPCIPMIREWAAVQKGYGLIDVMDDPDRYAACQHDCAMTVGYDSVSDLNAVNAEAEAMGCVLKNGDISVKKPAIEDYKRDLARIGSVDPEKDGRMPVILEGVRILKRICGNEKVVFSYVQAPFRAAAMLRGVERFLKDCLKDPVSVAALLEKVTENQIRFGSALSEAGADLIEVSDPMSSGDIVTRKQYESLGFSFSKRLIAGLKKTGVAIVHHACGDTTDRLDLFCALGADMLSLDQAVDLGEARRILPEDAVLFGNVDPLLLREGTPAEVRDAAFRCMKKGGQKGAFVLSSGCLISVDTPTENMQAMVDAACEYRYG
ncbi:MAG: uroporphyrinogen decarboxylase family protein [Spirochaetes bacterium]|nr:uroporphyrinogen decarboxylase family protein [Spirochaetota bacterium]